MQANNGFKSVVLPALVAGLFIMPVEGRAQRVIELPGQDRALQGTLEQVFSVGVEEGDRMQTFAQITGVAFDGAGNLYVLDRDNARVVVFGPNGRFVRSIGQKGEGPGEFGFPIGMGVLADGSVAVMDLANGAITMFDRTGKYDRLVRPDPQLVRPGPSAAMQTGAGNSLLMAGNQVMMRPNAPPQTSDSLPIIRIALDGANETTVFYRTFNKGPELTVSGDDNNRNVQLSAPPQFTPQVSWAARPDGGIATTPGSVYEIRLIGPDGRATATMKRPIQPRRVTERDKDRRKDQMREQMASGAGQVRMEVENGRRTVGAGPGMPPQAIEQRLAQTVWAETVPVVQAIRADRNGAIWVQRDGGSGSDDLPIDILKAAGEYVGTVKGTALPDAFGPSGLAAFIETDDLGVQRVVVRRIPQAWMR